MLALKKYIYSSLKPRVFFMVYARHTKRHLLPQSTALLKVNHAKNGDLSEDDSLFVGLCMQLRPAKVRVSEKES